MKRRWRAWYLLGKPEPSPIWSASAWEEPAQRWVKRPESGAGAAKVVILRDDGSRCQPQPPSERPILPLMRAPVVALVTLLILPGPVLLAGDWPQFRGPAGLGVSNEVDLP